MPILQLLGEVRLQRGDRLRDCGGREWIVRGPAYVDVEQGEYRVVLVSGALVRAHSRAEGEAAAWVVWTRTAETRLVRWSGTLPAA